MSNQVSYGTAIVQQSKRRMVAARQGEVAECRVEGIRVAVRLHGIRR